jgi:cytochrome c553
MIYRYQFKHILAAAWFAILSTLAPPALAQNTSLLTTQPIPQDTQSKRMQACTTCHGAGETASVGRTANEAYFPRIAGKPAGYLYNQLLNFREGRRHYGLMVGMVEHLSDAYLMEMAVYFAQLDLPYPPPTAPRPGTSPSVLARGQQLATLGDAARGIPACIACHGAALMGVAPALQAAGSLVSSQPSMPGLLGLPRDYMAGQLGAWQTGLRRAHAPDCMGRIAKLLTTDDVEALATWLAAQPVPTGKAGKPVASLPSAMPQACGGVK